MGSRSSKEVGASSSLGSVRKTGVFHSSCLGESSGSTYDDDYVSDSQNNAELESDTCMSIERKKPTTRKREFCAKVRFLHHSQIPSTTSKEDLNDWVHESNTHTESGVESSSTHTAVSQSSNRLFRSCSRFNFIPDNISLRFSRTGSLRSLLPCSLVSSNASVSNPEEAFHVNMRSSSSVRSVHPPTQFHDPSGQFEPSAASLPVHVQDRGIVSLSEMARDNTNATVGPALNRYSQTNNTEIQNTETRQTIRQVRAQDNVDGSIRFSRALSVGRLRDRVLCRTFSEGIFGHVSEAREAVDTRQASERLIWSSTRESSDGNAEMLPTSSSHQIASSSSQENGRQDYEVDPPNMREARNHALVEHRTAFLERRRRIRSQVRALQRLGRRFESLSGHDRACILSGQHRSGHCMCQASGLAPNPDEETGTRARISRIVMLAEALFEVLDEIHQQSVVLSSRPSVSCVGSVPAPKEIVDCMPVKIYRKPQKHQNGEVAQCYICLNEYEEGDCNRILPCHHEFHQLCIDKWLKEIHRVCPLCRGDVCRTDLSSLGKHSE